MIGSKCSYARGVDRAINKQNCYRSFKANAEMIVWLSRHRDEIIHSSVPTVILVLNVDAACKAIAEESHAMDYEKEVTRESFACTFVDRDKLVGTLRKFDREASDKLKEMADGLPVVVIDYGVAEVFTVAKALEEKK